jgi:hypothetical protein
VDGALIEPAPGLHTSVLYSNREEAEPAVTVAAQVQVFLRLEQF